MKKVILALVVLIMIGLTSCQYCSRKFGGDITVNLEPNEKLVEVTWKNSNLWYLVEPMEEDYTPKTKVFKESSNTGLLEGSVTFIETKK